ncbi:sensor histidine kinase [Aeromicrobium sp. CTD01-1L150]|uniref:sensor histidine kinase n=1 Tax=Aeromicrobium sp. CTD01-1L150 TaxID=3341830 RepID=UPI0035BFE1B9
MRVRDPEILAGALISALVILLVVPVLLIGGEILQIPVGAWLCLYALMSVSMMVSQWLYELLPPRVARSFVGVMVISTMAVVGTAPRLGYVPIAAVVSVAICAYYVPMRWVRTVAVANTVVIVGSQWFVGSPATALIFSGVVYLVLQLVTVMSIESQLSEDRIRHELQATNTDLRATRALLQESSRAQERLRIARELHDVVGHQLTALILELEIASHQASGDSHGHVVKARGIARDLMEDVRTAVGTQRELAPDLRGALEQVTTDLPGLEVHLTVDESVRPDPGTVTALVRATQEIVTNTLRHAWARTLWVEVGLRGDRIRLTAHDDGVGATTYAPGNGLRGMTERIQELGGTLDVEAGQGFRVRLAVPAESNA